MEEWALMLPSHLKKLSQKAFQPTVQLIAYMQMEQKEHQQMDRD